MSKIICDICGTSYPETAKQCPICGSVQSGDVQRVTNEVKNGGKGSTGYTQVKGGHFSKSNVKKRTKDSGTKPAAQNGGSAKGGSHSKDNRGLVITAIVLLLAVIGVVIYIAIGLLKSPVADPDNETLPDGRIFCKDIRLTKVTYYLADIGATEKIPATPIPETTTEIMEFTPYDSSIVTVDESGNITAVGLGYTYVEIKCGTISKTVTVYVGNPDDYKDPDDIGNGNGDQGDENNNNDENPNGNGDATDELRFVQYSLPMNVGETATLYVGTVPVKDIKWISDNPAIATFADGVVTAVGVGTTDVHAEYNGKKLTCTVTCTAGNSGGQTGNGGVTEDGGFTKYTGKIINVSEYVNVRSSPGVLAGDANLAGTLALNAQVTVYEEQPFLDQTWCRVSADGEPQKWVRSDFIQKD